MGVGVWLRGGRGLCSQHLPGSHDGKVERLCCNRCCGFELWRETGREEDWERRRGARELGEGASEGGGTEGGGRDKRGRRVEKEGLEHRGMYLCLRARAFAPNVYLFTLFIYPCSSVLRTPSRRPCPTTPCALSPPNLPPPPPPSVHRATTNQRKGGKYSERRPC